MTTISTATPDRRTGTSLSKYDDVEVGHWFRTPSGTWGPGVTQEIVDLEWDTAKGGVQVYLRNEGERTVHSYAYGPWRETVRPTLAPWQA